LKQWKNLFNYKKCCIGGSAFAIVAPSTVGALPNGQQKLTTFWRGIPPSMEKKVSDISKLLKN